MLVGLGVWVLDRRLGAAIVSAAAGALCIGACSRDPTFIDTGPGGSSTTTTTTSQGGSGVGGLGVSGSGGAGTAGGMVTGGGGALTCNLSTCGMTATSTCCPDNPNCVNTSNDILNCGTCASICPAPNPYCHAGACSVPPCAAMCSVDNVCCGAQCCAVGQLCCDTPGGLACASPVGGTCPP